MDKASNRNQVFNKINKRKQQNDIKEEKDVKGDVDVNVNDNVKDTGSVNIMIGPKAEDKHLKRTYYIYKDHDREISKLARRTGRDKSEIVRMALDYFLENVKVQ